MAEGGLTGLGDVGIGDEQGSFVLLASRRIIQLRSRPVVDSNCDSLAVLAFY